MSRLVATAIVCLLTSPVLAQNTASKMTREELLSFLPGTKTTHVVASSGSLRYWTNEPDGKFVASSSNKKYGSALGTQSAKASGTWRVSDEGEYCIDIDWKRLQEKWCAYVLKGPANTYYLNVADANHQIEFAK